MGGLAEGLQVQRVATQAGEGSRAQSSKTLTYRLKELVHLICFGQSRWGLELFLSLLSSGNSIRS